MNLFNMIEPLSIAREQELNRWAKITIGLLSLSTLCLGSYSMYQWLAVRQLQDQSISMQTALAHSPQKQEYSALKEKLADVNQKHNAHAITQAKRSALAAFFNLVPEYIPANLRFTRLHIKEDTTILCQLESNASDAAQACQECLHFFTNMPVITQAQLERIVSKQGKQSGALIDMRGILSY